VKAWRLAAGSGPAKWRGSRGWLLNAEVGYHITRRFSLGLQWSTMLSGECPRREGAQVGGAFRL